MENSPFRRLTRDVRDKIFEFALRHHSDIQEFNRHKYSSPTRVCRQIRAEANPIFYSQNDFVHKWDGAPNILDVRFTTFIANFDTDLLASIRSLAVAGFWDWDWVIRPNAVGRTTAKATERNIRELG